MLQKKYVLCAWYNICVVNIWKKKMRERDVGPLLCLVRRSRAKTGKKERMKERRGTVFVSLPAVFGSLSVVFVS